METPHSHDAVADVIVVGYNMVRGTYLDFLKTAPFFNVFTRY